MMSTLSRHSWLYISTHRSLVSSEGSDSLTPVRGEGMFWYLWLTLFPRSSKWGGWAVSVTRCWHLVAMSPREATVFSFFLASKTAAFCAVKNKHHRRRISCNHQKLGYENLPDLNIQVSLCTCKHHTPNMINWDTKVQKSIKKIII